MNKIYWFKYSLHISFLLLVFSVWSSCQTKNYRSFEISAEDFVKMNDTDQFVIIDVRTESEYEQSHLKNAILMDIYSPGMTERLNNLNKTKKYYVYCHSGIRSRSVIKLMRQQGFTDCYNISGGTIKLARAGAVFVN